MSLRVAIVEDDLLWRTNVEQLLRETEGVEFAGSFRTGEDAIRDLP